VRKVKGSSVKPNGIPGLRKLGVENIGLDPSDATSPRTETGAGLGQCCGRDVQDCGIVIAGIQEVIDQGGGPSAHINDRSIGWRADMANQVQRAQGMGLVPAHLCRELVAVNAFPVRLGVHSQPGFTAVIMTALTP
jgi:hypothetical protein